MNFKPKFKMNLKKWSEFQMWTEIWIQKSTGFLILSWKYNIYFKCKSFLKFWTVIKMYTKPVKQMKIKHLKINK